MSVNEKMTAIADTIREKIGGTKQLTLDDMATEIPNVYDAGKQAQYDAFWDGFLSTRYDANYAYRFAGCGWTPSNFKPNRNIKPTNAANGMFYGSMQQFVRQGVYLDLRKKQFKEKYGVEFDVSNAKNLQSWLADSAVMAVGTIDITKMSKRLYYMFFSAKCLQIIEKLILPTTAEPSMDTTSAFTNCNALTTIEEIEGLFGNSISFSSCPLDYDTIMRIINALADYSDGSYSKTLTLGTTNLAKLTDAEKAIATEKGWTLA